MDRHVLALMIQRVWNSFDCPATTNLSCREGVSARVKSSSFFFVALENFPQFFGSKIFLNRPNRVSNGVFGGRNYHDFLKISPSEAASAPEGEGGGLPQRFAPDFLNFPSTNKQKTIGSPSVSRSLIRSLCADESI